MTAPLRAFVLRGADAAAALDRLHVQAEVLGAIEGDGEVTVWLADALPPQPFADLTIEELPSAVANATSTGLEHDQPIAVADDLLVRPPWVARPVGFRGIELIVPRGMAFGSGEHASTKATLTLLHDGWDAPASFGDVGTGSGILAAYAAARGCPKIVACDVEEAAVAAARELLPQAQIALGGPETLAAADCVVANLTATELHGCLSTILTRWTGRSRLLFGGMREHEVAGVLARLPVAPDRLRRIEEFTAAVWAPAADVDQWPVFAGPRR
ncbi:MAG: 50S ribosomal protein L11 methyltransferase [Planctomycetes bacterium]|nr:50S ribosomal protein L11 methyltransferase [Planctomycetota bacterium]